MSPSHAILEGFRDLCSHKLRSFLTVLGVILGVASLLTMFAITKGMANSFRAQLEQTGELEKIRIVPDTPPQSQTERAEISPGLTYQDALALRQSSRLFQWVSPFVNQSARLQHGAKSDGTRTVGAEPDYVKMDRHRMEYGRFITPLDMEQKSRVVVLGDQVVQRLYGSQSSAVVGSWVKINDVLFRVIGTFPRYRTQAQERELADGVLEKRVARKKERGSRGREWDPFSWKHDLAVIPLTTMLSVFKSSNVVADVDQGPDLTISEIQVGLREAEKAEQGLDFIKNTLQQTHRGIEDFRLIYDKERFAEIDQQVGSMRISGGLIAGISLLVGGVGIMNIMLASITDRIREIGVRRAIGARPIDIFIQVMMEALLLSVMGGLLGIVLAQGMIYFLDEIVRIPNRPETEFLSVIISFAFALVIGVLAGIYPAIRASTLRPVEALKFE
jgi:putative ABC transport system permease protein